MMVVSITSVACESAGKWLESGCNFKIELTGLSMETEKRMIFRFQASTPGYMLVPCHETGNTREKAYSAGKGLVNASLDILAS